MEFVSKTREVLDFLDPDFRVLDRGRQRQACVGRNENPDYLPLLIQGVPVPEREKYCRSNTNYCRFNFREQFYDKEKMLFEQLFGLISIVRSRSDAQLNISARMGAGFLHSVLGLKQEIFEDKDPWLQQRLSKEEISKLEPNDLETISGRGLMPQALEYIRYFRKVLGEKALVYVDYTWGPFSLAHMIRGDKIFTDLYDDSEFVKHLMEIATALYVSGVATLKMAIGEPENQTFSDGFYLSNSGVWSNEDTAVLLSPSHLEEFVFPYLQKAYQPFEGAIVHFCGKADYLLEPLLELPEVKGVNLGQPSWQKLTYGQIMKMLLEKGKVYYGSWPKQEGESTESYFKRVLEPLEGKKRGLVLAYDLTEQEQKNPQAVMELWHSLQEEG